MSQERALREILVEIERDPSISQKRLSENVGISVGMVNWHIKRGVGKGLIKLQQAPARRYLYYLTPEGFLEKARLTADYLKSSFDIFKAGRRQYEALFDLCAANDWETVVLLGDGELSELAQLVCNRSSEVKVSAILPIELGTGNHHSVQIMNELGSEGRLKGVGRIDAAIGTDFGFQLVQQKDLESIARLLRLKTSQILVPAFLQ